MNNIITTSVESVRQIPGINPINRIGKRTRSIPSIVSTYGNVVEVYEPIRGFRGYTTTNVKVKGIPTEFKQFEEIPDLNPDSFDLSQEIVYDNYGLPIGSLGFNTNLEVSRVNPYDMVEPLSQAQLAIQLLLVDRAFSIVKKPEYLNILHIDREDYREFKNEDGKVFKISISGENIRIDKFTNIKTVDYYTADLYLDDTIVENGWYFFGEKYNYAESIKLFRALENFKRINRL